MKHRTRVVLQLAALCFVLATYGFAANDGYLYIVHGIPGRAIATNANPGFPIDVLISGVCQSRGLAFGSTDGPLTFSPGTYDVQISDANTLAPCTNPPIIESQVTINGGASVSAVAAVSTGQPSLLVFTDSLSSVTAGNARFVLSHAADAAELIATLTQVGVTNPKTFTVTVDPGKEGTLTVPAGTYLVQVVVDGSSTVLASETIGLANQSTTFTYAAGETSNNFLGLINKTVLGVF
jgi:Domain of unknown function (DUF4397)